MYAIATGCYSDYRIEKVTNDYLLAQQYCAYKNSKDSEYLNRDYAYRIEEMDLLEDVFQCEDSDLVYNYKVRLVFDRNQYGLKAQYSSSIVMLRSNSIILENAWYGYEYHCSDQADKSYIAVYNIVVDKEDEELAAAIALERAYVMLYELDCDITEDRVRLYDIMLSGHEPVMSVRLAIKFTVDDEFVVKNIEIDSRESYRRWDCKESVYKRANTVNFFRRIENKEDIVYFLKVDKTYDDLYDIESDEDIFHYFKNIISEAKAVKNLINDLEKSEWSLVMYRL